MTAAAALRQAADRPVHAQPWGHAKSLTGAVAGLAALLPFHLAHRALRPDAPPHVARLFHRWLCHALGMDVVCHGALAGHGGVLFVANHLSWADIPLLGSQLLGHFVAKSEVGQWGVVSQLANLQGTIYVERERRQTAGAQKNAIAARLAAGGNVILFPEGTSSDGVRVLPFKSALFSVLDDAPDAIVQPVSIAYTRINGLPVTRRQLPAVAWTGDSELAPHALDFMRLGRVRAEILVHPPVVRADFSSRKQLALECQQLVTAGYTQMMRGR